MLETNGDMEDFYIVAGNLFSTVLLAAGALLVWRGVVLRAAGTTWVVTMDVETRGRENTVTRYTKGARPHITERNK